MRTLPALAVWTAVTCAGAAAFSRQDDAAPADPASPLVTASLAAAVGAGSEMSGFAEAPPADAAAARETPAAPRSARPLAAGPDGTQDASAPPPAIPAQRAPRNSLLLDASAEPAPESIPLRPRVPGAYAPYQAPPPMLEQKLDAAALRASLMSRGFSDVSQLRLRGSAYICEATGPRRERVRLVVDAASGAIFGVEVIGYDNRRN